MDGSIHLFERLPQVDAIPRAEKGIANSSARTRPLVGLIRNSRSHRNEGRAGADDLGDNVLLATPRRRSELAGILAEFAEKHVDYVAIDGGDGTVRDVLTCGAGVFGDTWPTLMVLPGGKTNALALDLGIPTDWSFDDALAAAQHGETGASAPAGDCPAR